MADNFFDQFDAAPANAVPPVAPPESGNFFDQFDEEAPPPQTPIDKALGARDQEVAQFQAEQQKRYTQQQAYAAELIKQHPELAGPSTMQEPAPAVDPHNAQRAPPLAPREEAPKQQLGSGFNAAFQSALVEDPETKRKILAQTLFPHDPDGIYRVGFDKSGKPVYVGDDGKLHRVASGTASFGAHLLANSPEMLATGVGATAGPGVAALLATGAHGLKRVGAGAYYDEPQTSLGNLKSMAVEGGATLAGEGVGRSLVALGNRGRRIDFSPQNMRAAEQTVNDVKAKTGIDIDLAQASGDRRLIALRAFVARYPGPSANLVQTYEKAQNGQFHAATDEVLDRITKSAAPVPGEVAGQEGINAAKFAIDTARQKAAAAVDPLYKSAWAAMPKVTDPSVLGFMKLPYFERAYQEGQRIAALDEASAPVHLLTTTTWTRTKGPGGVHTMTPTVSTAPVPVPDLRGLDYTKRGIDQVVADLKKSGQRDEARALLGQKRKFVKALDAIAPDEYKAARAAWTKELNDNIRPLENGVIGVLSRIKDPQASKAVARVFGDTSLTPTMIADAKKAMAHEPDAWNQISRAWIARQYNKSQRVTQTGSELNPAGKFFQNLYGTPTARANTLAMLDKPAADALEGVMDAASRMASTPIAGSNTFRDTETAEIFKGLTGTGSSIIDAFRRPFDTLRTAAERRAVEQSTLQVAQGILDPTMRRKLNVVLKMKPSTQRNILLFNTLGAQTLKDYGQSIASEGDETEIIKPAE